MEKELNNIYQEMKRITKELQRLNRALEHNSTNSLDATDFAVKFSHALKRTLKKAPE